MAVTKGYVQGVGIPQHIIDQFDEYRKQETARPQDLVFINRKMERYSREGDPNRDTHRIPFNCHGCDGEGVCQFLGPIVRGRTRCEIRSIKQQNNVNNCVTECPTRRMMRYRKAHPETDETK